MRNIDFRQKLLMLSLAILSITLATRNVSAQVSGTKNIPGDYATIAAAIADLNTNGVGPGGVTINIAGGYTETITATLSLTATGTSSDPIVFQKSGAGANPLITAYTGGTGNVTTATPDGIWRLVGSDYVTIDGIDLAENAANVTASTAMEYGFGLFKASATNGAQNNTIRNCTISLSIINNASWTTGYLGTTGIAVHNALTTAASSVTVTSAAGTSSNNKFYTNTIQNCNTGIALVGYGASSPFTLGDTNNDVGGSAPGTGNIIKNFGGLTGASNAATGIYANNQWGLNVSYNTINNNDGAGVNHPSIIRGIYLASATSASANCNYNTVTVKGGGTTSSVYGIHVEFGATAASNIINIKNNIVEDFTYTTATTASMYGIYTSTSAASVAIDSNIVRNLNLGNGTGSLYGINWNGATPNQYLRYNQVYNLTRAASGTTYGLFSGSSAVNEYVNNNIVHDLSNTTTPTGAFTVRGIYQNTATGNKEFKNNQVYNLSAFSSSTSNVVEGIRVNYATADISQNTVYALSGAGSTVTGIGGTGATSGGTYNVYRNKIYDLSSTTANPVVIGILQTGANFNIHNNVIGDLRAPSASAANPIIGISINATSSSTTNRVYFNTIYLDATSLGANFGSSGIYHAGSSTATTAVLDLRNNIIVNNSVPNGTGVTAVLRRSGTNMANHGAASNNNLVYSNLAPSTPSYLLYFDGTNRDSTLAQYKARITSETNDVSEAPVWVSTTGSNAGYLDISTASGTAIESRGSSLGVYSLTDFNGNIRAGNPGFPAQVNGGGSMPDIGAYEFDGIPVIPTLSNATTAPAQCTATTHATSVTAIANSGSLSSVTLNYAYNGVAQTPIAMSNITGNTWSADIPAATAPTNATVTWFITATNTSGYSTSLNGATYADEPFTGATTSISVPGAPVCSGKPVAITANITRTSGISYTVGSGGGTSTTYPNPFYTNWSNTHNQYLIRASELLASGLTASDITALSFDITTGTTVLNNFTVKMANTTATDASVFLSPAFVTVFSAATVTPVIGVNTLNFQAGFAWDGVSNIVIEICHGNPSSTATISSTAVTDNTPYISTIHTNVSAATAGSVVCGDRTSNLTTYSVRPKFTFRSSSAIASIAWTDGVNPVGTGNPLIVSPTSNTSYSFTATDVNGCSVSSSAPGAVSVYSATMGGSYTIGGSGSYPSLTAAVAAYNNACTFSAPIEFVLTEPVYSTGTGETFPIIINNHPDASSVNTLTIKTGTGNDALISGNATSILVLNGAKYVTIDGSNNGTTSRNLTVADSSSATTSAVIWIRNASNGDSSTHNTLKNIIVNGNSNTTTFAGIGSGSSVIGNTSFGINNNFNTITNCKVSRAQYGIYSAGSSTGNKNQGTVISRNDLSSSAPNNIQLRGILVGFENNITIEYNKINNIVTSSGSVMGISLGMVNTNTYSPGGNEVTNAFVSKNTIGPVSTASGTSAFGIVAIPATSGVTVISNNIIYGVMSGATPSDFAAGIYVGGGNGSTTRVLFNSVSLTGSATRTTPNCYALAIGSGDPVVELKNNILYNTQLTSGTGNSYAIGLGSTTFANLTSDYNLFYTAGANAQFAVTGGIGATGTGTNAADIAAWRTATGKDANSISANPQYASDLLLMPAPASAVFGAGTAVAGVTTDIMDNPRAGTPSIGAYEQYTDIVPPAISYTVLGNDLNPAGSRTLTAFVTATDASGINVTSGLKPRVYFKKRGDANVFGANNSGTNGWKWVEATNAASPFDFVIDYTLIFGGSVTNADTIRYFVVAQDLAGTPNVASNPAEGFAGTSVSNVVTAPTTFEYIIVNQPPLSNNYDIGAGQSSPNYPTLTAALSDLKLRGANGPVTFTLLDTLYNTGTGETFPLVIPSYGGASAVNTLTIKPGAGVNTRIGANALTIFRFDAADYVTIDGSNNGSNSRNLTISDSSTSTSSAVIWLQTLAGNGATNNTIKNVVVIGNSNTTTLAGIGSGSATISNSSLGTDNDSNSFINCKVSRTQIGIYSAGASAGNKNQGTVISNNELNSVSPNNIQLRGILVGFENNITVSGNKVGNITSGSTVYGISLGVTTTNTYTPNGNEVTNALVSKNIVGPVTATGGVTSIGIAVAGATSGTNTIVNNSVMGVISAATPSDFAVGMYVNGGAGSTTRIYYNSVSLSGSATRSSPNCYALAIGPNDPVVDIKNNILYNVQTTTGTGNSYAIGLASSTFANLTSNYNMFYTAGGNAQFAVTGGIGATGTGSNVANIAAWRTATSQDANTIGGQDPLFISNSEVLIVDPSSPAIGAGTAIAGITTDVLDSVRNNPPTIGSSETPIDNKGPNISYTPLANTTNLTSATLTNVAINDFSLVNTTTGTAPRIYYKKKTDANLFGNYPTDNNSSFNGWKYQEALGTTSPFSFTLDYSILNGGSASFNDSILYFVVAQDLSVFNNVSANPAAGFTATSVNTITSAPAFPNGYVLTDAPMVGPYTVGSGGSYATLTDANYAVRTRGLQGDVELQIISSVTEPGTVLITPWVETGAGGYHLNIVPTIADTIFANSSNGGVITIYGADRVTIDGRIAGTGNNLTVINTNTSTTNPFTGVLVASQGTNAGCEDIIIRNLNISLGIASSANAAGIQVQGEHNKNIQLLANRISKAGIGIRSLSAGGAAGRNAGMLIANNEIGSDIASDYVLYGGIDVAGTAGAVIRENSIRNISNTVSSRLYGIQTGDHSTGTIITRNRIHGLFNPSSGGYGVFGINLNSNTNADSIEISNNVITRLAIYNYSTSSTIDNPFGIRITGGGRHRIVHNSVNLYGPSVGAGTTGSLAAALCITSNNANNLYVQNNIFAVKYQGLSGTTCYPVYAASGVTFAAIDNNNYDTTGAGSFGRIGYLGSAATTLAAWKGLTLQDNYSVSAASGFTDDTTLTINTAGTPNPLESGASVLTYVTEDYNGDARPKTTPTSFGGNLFPDMGAFEFDGAPMDVTPPLITYTPLTNNSSLTNRLFDVDIADNGAISSGLNLSPGSAPRVYYKKKSDGNMFSISNSSADSGWKWVEVSNGSTPFSFNIDYGRLLGGTVANGDTIVYFVTAQDNAATPNISGNPSAGFVATTVSTITSAPTTPNSYQIITLPPMSGTYSVGVSTPSDFATITAALVAVKQRGISAAVTLELKDISYTAGTGETFPLTIDEFAGASSVNTLTIKPAASTSTTIAGAGTSMIKINGADYVTIDGSNNGTETRNLTIENGSSSAGTNVIWVRSMGANAGAKNNTIKNVIIRNGDNTVDNVGIYVAGNTIATTGVGEQNDTLTIRNNKIELAKYGIYVGAPAAGPTTGLTIAGNDLSTAGSIGTYGIAATGISQAVIENNTIGNFGNIATSANKYGIYILSNSNNVAIRNNRISELNYTGSSGYAGQGIRIEPTETNGNVSNIDIYNNFIAGLTGDADGYVTFGASYSPVGVYVRYTVTNVRIMFNTIHLYGNTLNNEATSVGVGIALDDNAQATVLNNIIQNNLGLVSSTGTGAIGIALENGASQLVASDYNDIYCGASNGANAAGRIGATNYTTLASWRTATGKEANSKNFAVTFVSQTDLHLAAPSIGDTRLAGTPIVGITTDIDGETRFANYPYIGADENVANPVPVKLTSFTAAVKNNDVKLDWITASEMNNKGFDVERSVDGKTFEFVTFVKGAGNSNVKVQYVATDKNAFVNANSKVLYYRLKQVDLDGKFVYSNVIKVAVTELILTGNIVTYPNPFRSELAINFNSTEAGTATISLIDLLGKTVSVTNAEIVAGGAEVKLNDLEGLKSGVYMVQINFNGEIKTVKVVKAD